MADEDKVAEEAEAEVASHVKKEKSGLLPGLLKWVAIIVGAIVLIVTVVVVTMKIVGGNAPAVAVIPETPQYEGKRPALDWYTIGSIRAKTSDVIPASIMIEPVLGYKKEDKVTSAEITSRQIEIKDFLRRFFTEKKAQDLRPDKEEKLSIEIRNTINDQILTGSKILDVKFVTFDVIEQ